MHLEGTEQTERVSSQSFIPLSPSQWVKKQARASFQSRTSLPTVQRSIRLSRALHLGRSALSGCFALYSSLVQGATVASDVKSDTVYRRKIIFTPGQQFKEMLTRASVTRAGWDNSEVASGGGSNPGTGGNGEEEENPRG